MQYIGGKYREGKKIVSVILEDAGKKYDVWYDVFTGGGNMFFYVPQHFERYGIDIDCEVIEALKQIQRDPSVFPKNSLEFSKEDYYRIKKDKNAPLYLRGLIKYSYSYGRAVWNGFLKPEPNRDRVEEVYKHVSKQHKYIQNVKFVCADYKEFNYPKVGIIFADPPYVGSRRRSYQYESFNIEEFALWCIDMKEKGFAVYFTEYNDYSQYGFQILWQQERKSMLNLGDGRVKTERLWKV